MDPVSEGLHPRRELHAILVETAVIVTARQPSLIHVDMDIAFGGQTGFDERPGDILHSCLWEWMSWFGRMSRTGINVGIILHSEQDNLYKAGLISALVKGM